MSELVEVRTQAELDAALMRDGVIPVCVGKGFFSAYGSATVRASGSATVSASGSATVRAYGSATVRAYGSATVSASGSATVRAYDSATVSASGSATVRAYDSATVRASSSATVRAYDSATVRAYDSATVRASGSATVSASGSATVSAYGSATVRAYDSATVRASKYVAIHNHGGFGPPKITGGVVIDVPKPKTVQEWCEYRGVQIKRGRVVLFKAVRDEFKSTWGMDYTPGTKPVAADWDGGKAECGGGLHFCATPHEAGGFDAEATRYVACPIRVADIVVHENAVYPQKVKAKGCCAPVWECDIDGERITEKAAA